MVSDVMKHLGGDHIARLPLGEEDRVHHEEWITSMEFLLAGGVLLEIPFVFQRSGDVPVPGDLGKVPPHTMWGAF